MSEDRWITMTGGRRGIENQQRRGSDSDHGNAQSDVRELAGAHQSDEPLARQFSVLAQNLFAAETVDGVLQRVVEAALRIVPGTELVSVTLRSADGELSTLAHTAPLATRLDQLQYASAEGPCVQATRATGDGVAFSEDLALGREWPTFGPRAARLGARSVLSAGMFPFGDSPRLGALNLYAFRPRALDQRDRDIALLFACHAAAALGTAQSAQASNRKSENLRHALESRDLIGQAKGVLMERRGVGADEAFDILRRTSQELNMKLARVAHILVSRRDEI